MVLPHLECCPRRTVGKDWRVPRKHGLCCLYIITYTPHYVTYLTYLPVKDLDCLRRYDQVPNGDGFNSKRDGT